MSAATSDELQAAALQAHQAACAMDAIHASGSREETIDDAYGLVQNAVEALSQRLYELAQRRLGTGVFTDASADRVPYKNFPPALACGFCGSAKDIYIAETQQHDGNPWFRVSCGQCGLDAGGAETAREAAEQWNERGQFREKRP